MTRRRADFAAAAALWIAVAAALVPLARGLPSRTFFSGDSGVKLIVARNAIDHPARPLDIPLPRVGGRPVAFVDPFFRVSGGYAHAATPDLFPLVSAPLIAAFGLRGAYLLPAVGLLAAIWAIAAVGVALDDRRSRALLVLVAAACTPLLFYGLEFWEHAPAAGLAATATWLCVTRRARGALAGAGALLGVAALLRPEAIWYAVAVVVAARALTPPLTRAQLAAFAAGAAAVLVPFAIASTIVSGQLLGAHIGRNMSGVAAQWTRTRVEYVRVWLGPGDVAWIASLVLIAIAALIAAYTPRLSRAATVAGLAWLTGVAFAAATRSFDRSTLWNAAPALVAVAVIPAWGIRRGQPFLLVVAGVSAALVALTSPSEGGAQWGPRYLLLSVIPLAILTADAFQAAIARWRVVGAVAAGVIIAASLVVQRNAYEDLKFAKRAYEHVVAFVERETRAGSCIVTDLWWFDQVVAALHPTRVVLFADTPAALADAMRAAAAMPEVYAVWSGEESHGGAMPPIHPPFLIGRRARIEERSLSLAELVQR